MPRPAPRSAAVVAAALSCLIVAGDIAAIVMNGGGGASSSSRPGARHVVPSPNPSQATPRPPKAKPPTTKPSTPPKGTPQHQPPSSPSSPRPPAPRSSLERLLDEHVGFGGGTTGGAGGRVEVVSSSADSGPGSLRQALTTSGPRWVVFSRDMTINLAAPLAVPSQTTIDGRGHRILLTGHGHDGLEIVGVHDVIVENIALRDFGDVSRTHANNKPDAIHIAAASDVWIDHCDLSMTGDKLISVDKGTRGLSVTWNHFFDQQQVFQVGDQTNRATDVNQTATVAFNYFDHTGYRNPVVSYGKAHVYNNYFRDWGVYAVRSQRTAQMYLERNVFIAGSNDRASLVKPGGDGCNDSGKYCDKAPGLLAAVGNYLGNGAHLITNHPEQVFRPSAYYRYTARPATMALASLVAARAGTR